MTRVGLAVRRLGMVSAAVGSLWFAGLVWFAATVPDQVDDTTTRTDAIVVLTGGSERLTTGLQLLEAGLADQLFISGVHKGVDVQGILKRSHAALPELAGAIVLGYAADDTVGNAAEIAAWVAGRQLRSLRLVTAAYHMRRSLTEIHHAIPEVTIIPHPVFPDAVKSHQWWLWPGTAALLATEYSKYLAAVFRHTLVPRQGMPT